MHSPLSAAVLRAISFPSHFRSPSHNFIHRSVPRSADAALRRIASPSSTITFSMHRRRSERNGAAKSASEIWPAGMCSRRSNLAESEGKCGDGGKREGRGRSVDSCVDERCGEGNADEGCKKVLREEEGVSYSRLLTLPTVITLGRVAAVPILVSTFHMDGSWATTTTTGIFLVAAFTDWLDGYLARKMQLGTTFGAFLDPVADKLMVATTLVLLCSKPLEVAFFGVVPWILSVPAIAIIGREITMSAVREWAASQNSRVLEAVAVNNLGKWKTATQMTALTILLLTRDPSLTGAGFLVSTGVLLLYVSAGLALWSLAVYMRKIWRFMIK